MRLKCNKCGHGWSEEVDAGQAVVMCPECMAIVPMALAGAAGGAAPPPRPARPAPGSAPSGDSPRSALARRPTPAAPSPAPSGPAGGSSGVELNCNKCPHSWTEEVEDGQPVVQCPKCMAIVPTVVARAPRGRTSPARPDPRMAETVVPGRPDPRLAETLAPGRTSPGGPGGVSPARAAMRALDDDDPLERTVIERKPIAPAAGSPARPSSHADDDPLERTVIERPAARAAAPPASSAPASPAPAARAPFAFSDAPDAPWAGMPPPAPPSAPSPAPPPPAGELTALDFSPVEKTLIEPRRDVLPDEPPVRSAQAPLAQRPARPAGGASERPSFRVRREEPPAFDEGGSFGVAESEAPPAPRAPVAQRPTRPSAPAAPTGGVFSEDSPEPSLRPERPAARGSVEESHPPIPRAPVAQRPARPAPRAAEPESPSSFHEEPTFVGESGPPPRGASGATTMGATVPGAPSPGTWDFLDAPPPSASPSGADPLDALSFHEFDMKAAMQGGGSVGGATETAPGRRTAGSSERTVTARPGTPAAGAPGGRARFGAARGSNLEASEAPTMAPAATGFNELASEAPTFAPGVDSDDAPWNAPTNTARPPARRDPAGVSTVGGLLVADDPLVGKTLGGYEIVKKLGQGGMGAVYLARQISLDREVAIKTLVPKYANNPDLLSRFTREALSAAQLSHHNVVQVIDVGSEQGVHYIAMEFVRGRNLGDMVRDEGRMPVDSAVAYILQAARGLHYAHERGVIHRDIKPDNLMLNEHGIVKIADMGLAKMRGEQENVRPGRRDPTVLARARGDLTGIDIAMGTPAYMPPEQARDAANVDDRADQYSLGCTLFYLCAGRAPFQGTTAMELISAHLSETAPQLAELVGGRVPESLNKIISRTLEKDPDARYPDMGEFVAELENFLGVSDERGAPAIQERQLEKLEIAQSEYYAAPAMKRRTLVSAGFFVAMPILVVALALTGNALLAGGVAGLLVLTPVLTILLDGMLDRTPLFRRMRAVFFGMTWRGWIGTLGTAFALALVFLSTTPMSYLWLGFAFVALALAAIRRRLVLKPLREQRKDALARMEEVLKKLRLRGVSEEALQQFVFRYGGAHWEEFFEEFFGYGPMILARRKWAALDQATPRKRHAIWREPIMRALDGIEEARKKAREARELERVETARLRSKGMPEKDARKKAREATEKVMEEGLLQATQTRAKEKLDAAGADLKFKKLSRRSAGPRPGFVHVILQMARLAVGAGVMAAWGLNDAGVFTAPIPPPLADMKDAFFGHYGLAAGIVTFLLGFSAGRIMPWVAFAGAAAVVAAKPIHDAIPGLSEQTLTWGGLAAMGVGFGLCLLNKLTGGRF